MRFPNIFIVGAGKSGTSLLHDMLNRHPNVHMSRVKETDFFAIDHIWSRGYDWYWSNYGSIDFELADYVGEASVSYSAISFYPKTIDRMIKASLSPKIIYIVRDPLKRFESDWMEHTIACSSKGRTPSSFSDFIQFDDLAIAKTDYLSNCQAYINAFGRGNVHLMLFEDLIENPVLTMQKVYQFLKLDYSCVSLQLPMSPVGPSSGAKRVPNLLMVMRRLGFYNKIVPLIPSGFRVFFRDLVSKRVNVERPNVSSCDMELFISTHKKNILKFNELYLDPGDKWPCLKHFD